MIVRIRSHGVAWAVGLSLVVAGMAHAQEVEARTSKGGALGLCEMKLIDPYDHSALLKYAKGARYFPSLAECNLKMPTICNIERLGDLIAGLMAREGLSLPALLEDFYDREGLKSYTRWECFEMPDGNVISDPEKFPEFTKPWQPVRVPAFPPDLNLDDVRQRYPGVGYPGLGWDLALHLTEAERLGLLERARDGAMVLTASGALAWTGYRLWAGSSASSALGGLRAVPLPVAVLLVGSALLSSSTTAYAEIAERPEKFAELTPKHQQDILANHPGVAERVRWFDARLETLLGAQRAKGFDAVFPASTGANPIYRAGDEVRLTMPPDADRIELKLYGTDGAVIDSGTYFRSALEWSVTLPTKRMKAGVYYLVLDGYGADPRHPARILVKKIAYLKDGAPVPVRVKN